MFDIANHFPAKNAIRLHAGFCKNFPELSPDTSSINPMLHGPRHQYIMLGLPSIQLFLFNETITVTNNDKNYCYDSFED